MKKFEDYPRMMFHRTRDPVVIQSRDEEDELGAEWRRTVWPPQSPAEPAPEPIPAVSAAPEQDPVSGGNSDPPAEDEAPAFEPAPKARKPAAKKKK